MFDCIGMELISGAVLCCAELATTPLPFTVEGWHAAAAANRLRVDIDVNAL